MTGAVSTIFHFADLFEINLVYLLFRVSIVRDDSFPTESSSIHYPGIQYFVLSLLWSGMINQEVLQNIHASFNCPVMHHLKNLRVHYAVQCALHNRHASIMLSGLCLLVMFIQV